MIDICLRINRFELLTFTSYSGKIFQSFSTDIAKFTFKPGYIRPNMAHGILMNTKYGFLSMNSSRRKKQKLKIYFYKYRCNTWAWWNNKFSASFMTNKIANFAIITLSYETPEHFNTMMTIGWFVKRFFNKKMSIIFIGLLIDIRTITI